MPDKIKSQFDFSKVNNIVGIHGEIEGILEFYIKDRDLEGFWANRKVVYEQLKKQNFKAIITPNFLLYEDAPRSEHLYNIQQAKKVYNEMIQEGLSAILDIIWALMKI